MKEIFYHHFNNTLLDLYLICDEIKISRLFIKFTGAASAIDHFAVTNNLYYFINAVEVTDSGINISDHCKIILDICS